MLVTDGGYPKIYTKHSQTSGLVYVVLEAGQRPVCVDYGREHYHLQMRAWWSSSYANEAELQQDRTATERWGGEHARRWLRGARVIDD